MAVSATSWGEGGGGGAESGGGILGGIVSVSGPENLVHAGLMQLLKGGGSRTRAILGQSLLGTAGIIDQQAYDESRAAWGRYYKQSRRAAGRGEAPPPAPPPIFQRGSILSQVLATGQPLGVFQQNSGSPSPTTSAPTPTTAATPWWQRAQAGLGDAIAAGLKIAEYVAYLRALFSSFTGGGGAGGYARAGNYTNGGQGMGYFLTSGSMGIPGGYDETGGGGFLGGLGSLAGGIGAVIAAARGGSATAFPGGAMGLGNYGGVTGVLAQTALGRAMGLSGGSMASAMGASCAVGGAVGITNPSTGRMVWFRRAGRPLLWSGDLAACKRVRKAASHARRRVGGR